MTPKETVQTLRQYRTLHLECEQLRQRIIDKRHEMYDIQAVVSDSAKVRSGAIADRVESVVEAMDSMTHYYAAKLEERETAEHRIIEMIEQLSDTEERSVLFLHYIEGKSFLDVSELMFLSERTIWNRHNSAVRNISDRLSGI